MENWSVSAIVILFVLGQSFCEVKILDTKDEFYSVVGIFEKSAELQLKAFNESMRSAGIRELTLRPFMLSPYRTDSYSLWRELCVNRNNPIVVIGPQHPVTDGAIKDQCYRSNIPYLQVTAQPYNPDTEVGEFVETDDEEDLFESDPPVEENIEKETDLGPSLKFKKIAINFYPDIDEIAQAYSQILKYYKWEGFAALYEDDYGLMRVQKVLAEHTDKYPVTVKKLNPIGDNKNVFKELANFQESRIFMDCNAQRIYQYMEEANAVNMINHYQHYILGTMDASIVAENLTRFQSNITWLSITDYDRLRDPQHYLAQRVGRWVSDYPHLASAPVASLETEVLIMDDLAKHVLKALQAVSNKTVIKAPPTACSQEDPWKVGVILQSEILQARNTDDGYSKWLCKNQTQTTGVSGHIEFNEMGKRVNYTLNVNQINVSTRKTIGFWESANSSYIHMDYQSQDVAQQTSKHFYIVSRKAKPFFYPKENKSYLDEDDDGLKFEGFTVDLVKGIFEYLTKNLKYNYTYSFLEDEYRSIGTYNPVTRKWDGVFGVIMEKKADLAICDITITEERKKHVDFSVPFMNLGISILYTKEHKIDRPMFSFLLPYSVEVWIYTLTAYCVVSMTMYICSRLSPADWENPQPCGKEPEELENIWNFKNCAWLTMGSIMTQGCDILPKAVGSRWVCGMWWFFAMIVCQTYIAQLAATMTSAMSNEPMNSIEDLAKQNKVLYGALKGGSTLEFFKNSKNKMYHRLYENMMSNPVVLVDDIDEGEKRVLKGNSKYAFFMESSTIKYKLRRNCDLKEVGNKLDSKDYGIAMPANSPFRSHINAGILYLRDKTLLDGMQKKWWEEAYGANEIECEEEKEEGDEENDLEIKDLLGAFIVLIGGLFISIFISAAEFVDEVRNIVVNERITHKEAFLREIKFALNFFKTEKPVAVDLTPELSEGSSEIDESRKEKRKNLLDNFMDLEKIKQ